MNFNDKSYLFLKLYLHTVVYYHPITNNYHSMLFPLSHYYRGKLFMLSTYYESYTHILLLNFRT